MYDAASGVAHVALEADTPSNTRTLLNHLAWQVLGGNVS